MSNESLQPKIVEHILDANDVYQSNKLIFIPIKSYCSIILVFLKHKKNITNLFIDVFKLSAAFVFRDCKFILYCRKGVFQAKF